MLFGQINTISHKQINCFLLSSIIISKDNESNSAGGNIYIEKIGVNLQPYLRSLFQGR